MTEERVLKVGELFKRARNRSGMNFTSGWQERTMTLTPTKLAYAAVGGPIKDFITLSPVTTVDICTESGKDNCFRVATGAEDLVLSAKSDADRSDWICAIRMAIDPSAGDGNNDERLAAEMERLRIQKEQAAAEEAERQRQLQAETEAARKEREEAEQARKKAIEEAEARRQEEERRLQAEAEARRRAEEERKQLYLQLESPCACMKKLSTEGSYKARYVWVNPATKEFFWAKTNAPAEVAEKSKSIKLSQHVKDIVQDENNDTPNVKIELVDASLLPDNVFSSKLFSSAVPSSIDITMDDAKLMKALVSYMNDLRA